MSIAATDPALSTRGASRRADTARLLPIGLVLGATLACLPSLRGLGALWLGGVDSPYSHGPLLALVALGLAWHAGAGLDLRRARGSPAALLALGLVLLAWVAAGLAQVSSAAECLWPLIAWLAIAAVLGPTLAGRYLVPLGLLYFALPIWSPFVDAVLWPLAASMPTVLLGLIGTPVFLEGHVIHVPEGTFEVAFGCTGLHFFLAASVVAVLAAYLGRATRREWFVLYASAAVLAMVANWLRIAAVVEAGHLTEMQHPWVTVDHRPLGWKIFAVMILLYCLAVRRWLPVHEAPSEAEPATDPTVPTDGRAAARPRPLLPRLAVTLGLLALGPVWVAAADRLESVPTRLPLALPAVVAGLGARRAASSSAWQPRFLGAAVAARADYGDGEAVVSVYEAAYGGETGTGKLVFYWNSVTGPDWRTTAERGADLPAGYGSGSSRELEAVDPRGHPWLVRYAYAVGDRYTANPIEVQGRIAAGALLFRPPARGVVATAARCTATCAAARRDSDLLWRGMIAR